jgi:hypothetical protein
LLIAIIYIDRFQQKGKNIVLNHFNIHRLLLTRCELEPSHGRPSGALPTF